MKKIEYPRLSKFIQMQVEHEQAHPGELFPISIDSRQFIIDCLLEGLLGPDWYTTWPCGDSQVNPIILNEILLKYSKPYANWSNKSKRRLRMQKIKILAICGKAGAGKDTLLRILADRYNVHEIISCTTRPMREGEKEGINYYYLTKEQFAQKIMDDEMLECTEFNGWFYGTMKQGLDLEGWNIGVFNPEGIEMLEGNFDVEIHTIYINVPGKERLIRQLNREENPDVDEIVRRYSADEKDFRFIEDRFPFYEIENLSKESLKISAYNIAEMFGLKDKNG